MSGTSDEPRRNEKSSSGARKQHDVKSSYRLMRSYSHFLAATVLTYVSFFLFGYSGLIVLMFYFVVVVFHEVAYILANLNFGLARNAALLNAAVSSGFYFILCVNDFGISRYGFPLILPEIADLTIICPVFVMLGLFGCRNIRIIYCPSSS